jgi:hypothetical protein
MTGIGGDVDPDGVTAVNHGSSITYTITPDDEYIIKTVLVDGKNNAAAVATGTYTFTNVTAKHTISATFVHVSSAPTIGESEGELSDITIYPNPTNGQLKIDNGQLKIENVGIFDVMGRMCNVETLRATSLQSTTTLNLSHLPVGIYFIRIITEHETIIRKIVKN